MIEKHCVELKHLGDKLKAVELICETPVAMGWFLYLTNDPDALAQRTVKPYPVNPMPDLSVPLDYVRCEEKAA